MTAYVIQSAQGTATSSPGTVTFAGTVRAGNTIIAMASVRNAGTANAALTNVTLAGAQDNFAQAISFGSATTPGALYWWLDPLCAGGQRNVVFTTTGGAGAEALTMNILEVGGMVPLPAGPGAVDVFSAGTVAAGTASWNSGTVQTTGWASEIWTGQVVAAGTQAVTAPGWPWVNQTVLTNGTVSITETGYDITPVTGLASYSGTFAAAQPYLAAAVTFPAIAASPIHPDFLAGFGVQQGDMENLVTSTVGFCQQKVIFRAAQLTTTTTLAAGNPGTFSVIGYDTVFEDPYQGWNTSTHAWSPPFSGYYWVEYSISVGTCALNTILSTTNAAMVMPTTGGIIQESRPLFLTQGFDTLSISALLYNGAGNVLTSNSPGSTLEIHWLCV